MATTASDSASVSLRVASMDTDEFTRPLRILEKSAVVREHIREAMETCLGSSTVLECKKSALRIADVATAFLVEFERENGDATASTNSELANHSNIFLPMVQKCSSSATTASDSSIATPRSAVKQHGTFWNTGGEPHTSPTHNNPLEDRSTSHRSAHPVGSWSPNNSPSRSPQTQSLLQQPTHTLFQVFPLDSSQFEQGPLANTLSERSEPDGSVRVEAELDRGVDSIGNKHINGFTEVGFLGRGAYGKVKLVADDDGNLYAMKVMNKSLLKRVTKPGGLSALQQAQREVAIMKRMHHKNVVRLHYVIDDPHAEKMYLVMDYLQHGPIAKLNQDGTCLPADPTQLKHLARQILSGLNYMHKHGVCHRDIKPDNILLTDTSVARITDFGVSEVTQSSSDKLCGIEGTPFFLAPELCGGTAAVSSGVNGFLADVWSLGATFYTILYGVVPFHGTRITDLFRAIQDTEPAFPPVSFSASNEHAAEVESFSELIKLMLVKDPTKRITMHDAMHHPSIAKPDHHHYHDELELSTNLTVDEVEQAITSISSVRKKE